MIRRDFLKTGAAATSASLLGGVARAATPPASPADLGPGPILTSFSAEDHRRRLENLREREQGIRKCLRKHQITNYIPGQVSYNLGEYPCRKPYNPGDADEQELDRLRDGGIRLIGIMEDWNDMLRLFGGTKFTAVNPEGLRRFIGMAHKRGMKVLLYASTGYMQEGDPDLKEDWVRGGTHRKRVQGSHWRLVRCSPASPGWRAYMLPRTLGILDDYGCDGLYNDWGYRNLATTEFPPTAEELLAFKETPEHDAALEDLIALIYSEVKRRGGIYKMHADNNHRPMFDRQLYDYLWVGEGVGSLDKTRLESKGHPPYVIPCFDFRNGKVPSEDEMYVQTIPYMQFPLLLGGQPFTGERAAIPGVRYDPPEKDKLRREWLEMWDYYQKHPNGPYVYGPWDAFPPRQGVREKHAYWLKRYLPLVEEGTWAYLEITDSDLFAEPPADGLVASAFVNLRSYLVLANYGKTKATVRTRQKYTNTGAAGPAAEEWTLEAGAMRILERV